MDYIRINIFSTLDFKKGSMSNFTGKTLETVEDCIDEAYRLIETSNVDFIVEEDDLGEE